MPSTTVDPAEVSRSPGWLPRGKDFYSDRTGRFDLFASACGGRWLCIDWDYGVMVRGARARCMAWAASRLNQTKGL